MRACWTSLPAALFVMVVQPSIAASGQGYWSRLMVEGMYQQDSSKFLAAVRVAEKFGENDPRLHIALHDAGVSYASENKNPALAEELLKRDIANLEKISVDFPDIVSDCFELAILYEIHGRYNEAESLLLRAIAIRKKWNDVQSNDPYNAVIYSSLYFAYYMKGDYAKAADAKSEMLNALAVCQNEKARSQCLADLHRNFYRYAMSCNHIEPPQKQHLLEMALGFSMESAECEKKLGGELAFAEAKIGVAEVYMAMGRYADAEKLLRWILGMTEKDLASERFHAFSAFDRLATIICGQHIDEVEQLQDDYLSKIARIFGKNSETYTMEVNKFVETWRREKHPEMADKLRRQTLIAKSGKK